MRLDVVPPSVAFLAIIQMLDQLIIYLGTRVDTDVSCTIICEYIFYPIAWLVISVVVVWPAALVCKHALNGLAFPNTCAPKSGQPRKLQAVKSTFHVPGINRSNTSPCSQITRIMRTPIVPNHQPVYQRGRFQSHKKSGIHPTYRATRSQSLGF
jgi:hypothetical protein